MGEAAEKAVEGGRYLERWWYSASGRAGPTGVLARLDAVAAAAVVGDFKLGAFIVPPEVAVLPLADGRHVALVDADVAERAAQCVWSVKRYGTDLFGYVYRRPGSVALHRSILDAPDGSVIDHRNRLVLDCRRSNLRYASTFENAWNVARWKGHGYSSQFFGVSKTRKGWLAILFHKRDRVEVGVFDDEVDAAKAYDAKCAELRGEFAVLNFPEVVNG